MAKCWYLCGDGQGETLSNPRAANQGDTVAKVSWTTLSSKLHVKYWQLEIANYDTFNTFALIKQREKLGNETKVTLTSAEFDFAQHLHETDEARFLLRGELFYDVFDEEQRLVRMHLVPGDLVVIPKCLFHRTVLPQNVKSVTFLQLTPSAAADDNEEHKEVDTKTHFMADVQKNPMYFMRLMAESERLRTVSKLKTSQVELHVFLTCF